MIEQLESKRTHRAAATPSELEKAKRSLNPSPMVALARVALSVIYMYLIVMSYNTMGIAGPVFISVLFLLAFFIPHAFQAFTKLLRQRRERETQPVSTEKVGQEG